MALLLGGLWLALLAPGCKTVPMSSVVDASQVEVKVLALSSTRQVGPGDPTRFQISVYNRGEVPLVIDELWASIEAVSEHEPPNRLFSATWSYRDIGEKGIVLSPGKRFEFPVVPEPKEFPLGLQPPGDYDVRLTLLDRFQSPPLKVRVLERGSRRLPATRPDSRPVPAPSRRRPPRPPRIRL